MKVYSLGKEVHLIHHLYFKMGLGWVRKFDHTVIASSDISPARAEPAHIDPFLMSRQFGNTNDFGLYGVRVREAPDLQGSIMFY